MHCTTGVDEVWGGNGREDPFFAQIKDIIIVYNFIDIRPCKFGLTWDNGRMGNGYVAKRLDQFLL